MIYGSKVIDLSNHPMTLDSAKHIKGIHSAITKTKKEICFANLKIVFDDNNGSFELSTFSLMFGKVSGFDYPTLVSKSFTVHSHLGTFTFYFIVEPDDTIKLRTE